MIKSTLAALFLCLTSFLPVAPQAGGNPGVPGPSNPYCDTFEDDFLMPEVTCPTTGGIYVVNYTCVMQCFAIFKVRMALLYNQACADYESANQFYRQQFETALMEYNLCMRQADNQAQEDICRDKLIQSVTSAFNHLSYVRSTIETNLAEQTAIAVQEFQNCAAECCEQQ